jgi:sugar O-acyltransferase (sialic acid O-acetyltransferase NeuD family)
MAIEVLQIIGKGGLGREIAGYASAIGIIPSLFEYECNGMKNYENTVIAIGDAEVRKKIAERFSDFHFSSFEAGKNFGTNKIGKGAIICPGTILTVNIKIGDHCIINLNCTIGHDCVIGDFVTISPGANISGNVTIGNGCYIGTNAVIREKISICDNVIIGAGGVVVKNITEPGVYVGNPVKKLV